MGPGSIAASVRSVRSVLSQQRSRVNSSFVSDAQSVASGERGGYEPGSSSEEEDEDEDEDDIESLFLYSRVAHLPPTFFRKDAVSALLVTPGCDTHVYGTHSGIVHLCRADSTPIRTVRVHRSSVLDIHSSNNEFVATASIDGTVVITAIKDPTDLVQASFKRPVHAIALHPDYRNHRSYVSGGTAGQVVLSERGWLKNRVDSVLVQTKSTILALRWPIGSRLVFCNEDGITVYNPESKLVVSQIRRNPHAPRADLFRPRIFEVETEKTVVVAWHKTLFVIDLISGAEIVDRIECSAVLAGAVPFHGLSQFVVLCMDDEQQPQLRILEARSGETTYEDELELNGHKLGVNDYHLGLGTTEDRKLWIVSCGDAVIARERTARDHVDWLLERNRFTDAFAACKNPASQVNLSEQRSIGLRAAQQLISTKNWQQAAYILQEVLGEDRTEWLLWSNQYLEADQHLVWGDVIPPLELGGVHDAVLDAAVSTAISTGDTSKLANYVETWPLTVFNPHAFVARLETQISSPSSSFTVNTNSNTNSIKAVLASLYMRLDEFVKAALLFVSINSPKAFEVVSHYHLWSEHKIQECLGSVLSSGNGEDGSGGFVDRLREVIRCRAEITPSKVVSQLIKDQEQDLLLFGYLTELGLVDETWLGEFADLMVQLYAKYDPQKLLGFLERFDTYNIDKSIALCREKEFDNELVYLLGCVGKPQESLRIIVEKLHNYEYAVSFARTQSPEIWDNLVAYCSEHPNLVLALLKCVEVSPARVLAMVPNTMKIDGLKQALCKVLNSQEVSLELSNGTLEIVRTESEQWTRALRALRVKGLVLSDQEDWSCPQLVSEYGKEKVESMGEGVMTFSGKIRHLKYVLGLSK